MLPTGAAKTNSAIAMTIAGSDPSGGAGLQADLKTFQRLNVYGASVVTLITVQNTRCVERVMVLGTELVKEQYAAVHSDLQPAAIKTGALGSRDMVATVAECLSSFAGPIVVDPVLVSKHGDRLADTATEGAVLDLLLPLSWLITPNRFEAERLTGITSDSSPRQENRASVEKMLDRLQAAGATNVLLKWGEVNGESIHWLRTSDGHSERIGTPRVRAGYNHGAGCVLSAALTAYAAMGKKVVAQIARGAVDRTFESIDSQSCIGTGVHPVDVRRMQCR